jgi:hypothetical protein
MNTYINYMRLLIPNLDEHIRSASDQPTTTKDKDKTDKDKEQGRSKSSDGRESRAAESPGSSASASSADSPITTEFDDLERISTIPESPVYLNALLGRLFFDFLRSQHWKEVIMGVIQKKLTILKKPPFLEELIIKDLYLGSTFPNIHR